MAQKTKNKAPTGADKTKTAGKAPAYSGTSKGDYAGKPAGGKPYAGKDAYDPKTVDELKSALYKVAEGHYAAISQKPLTDDQKSSIRGGIDGVVDLLLLVRKVDPKLTDGLAAVVAANAGQRYNVHSPEARHYLSEIARGFAEKAELKPYEQPVAEKPGGYGGAPGGGYSLPPDLGQLLESYLGRGPGSQPAGKPPGYSNKGA